MSYLTPSPSKPVPSTPRRDSIHHAIVNAKNNNSPPSIRRQMRRNRVLRDIPTSQLTWDNYISSQKLFDKRRKTNPLRLISTLRHVLFSRKYITTRAVGIVELREKFEMLLTEINGPWNGLHDTLRSIPVGQAQVLQIANARFITLINDWSPPLQGSLISFSCRQETRQVIQELNVAIEQAALIKTRELEDMRIKAKHEEFALHLFRQGDENSPPAVLWSKKTRQNKRIYTRLQLVDSIYQSIGHVCFMSEYTNVKLNLLKKKE